MNGKNLLFAILAIKANEKLCFLLFQIPISFVSVCGFPMGNKLMSTLLIKQTQRIVNNCSAVSLPPQEDFLSIQLLLLLHLCVYLCP